MIIGLTGGSGTGKTTVSEYFAQKGYTVIDYDKITREVYLKGSACLNEITASFGTDILNPDGNLNRRRLGEIVFGDRNSLDILNKIVYKYIISYTKDILQGHEGTFIFLDAPTLFESGLWEKCHKIIGVISDRNLRIERITKRDGIDRQSAVKRIESQKDDEFYKENCDFIIVNNSNPEELTKKAQDILNKLL